MASPNSNFHTKLIPFYPVDDRENERSLQREQDYLGPEWRLVSATPYAGVQGTLYLCTVWNETVTEQ